jgi:hypothetical protein
MVFRMAITFPVPHSLGAGDLSEPEQLSALPDLDLLDRRSGLKNKGGDLCPFLFPGRARILEIA